MDAVCAGDGAGAGTDAAASVASADAIALLRFCSYCWNIPNCCCLTLHTISVRFVYN